MIDNNSLRNKNEESKYTETHTKSRILCFNSNKNRKIHKRKQTHLLEKQMINGLFSFDNNEKNHNVQANTTRFNKFKYQKKIKLMPRYTTSELFSNANNQKRKEGVKLEEINQESFPSREKKHN